MTSGSLREYVKRIKTLRVKVIKKWMTKVLEGIKYLHSNNIIHGRISGKSIYMNNGGIKIGDLGVRTISTYAFIPRAQVDFEGLLNIDIVKDQPQDKSWDVFYLGLLLLEIMTITEHHSAFAKICKMISNGDKEIVFKRIPNMKCRDFVSACMMDDPDDRPTVEELLKHSFICDDEEKGASDTLRFKAGFMETLKL